jgi:hypothetical protein
MATRLSLESTQPHIQRVPSVISPGVKRPGREADHLPPYTVQVYDSTPPIRLNGVLLS